MLEFIEDKLCAGVSSRQLHIPSSAWPCKPVTHHHELCSSNLSSSRIVTTEAAIFFPSSTKVFLHCLIMPCPEWKLPVNVSFFLSNLPGSCSRYRGFLFVFLVANDGINSHPGSQRNTAPLRAQHYGHGSPGCPNTSPPLDISTVLCVFDKAIFLLLFFEKISQTCRIKVTPSGRTVTS